MRTGTISTLAAAALLGFQAGIFAQVQLAIQSQIVMISRKQCTNLQEP